MDDYTPFDEPGRVRVRGAEQRNSGIVRFRRISLPVARVGIYTSADWDAACFSFYAEGADPSECPECARTGFFGPRVVEPDIKCRSCRFCGFWQQADADHIRHLPTAHGCEAWPQVSRADYLWWVAPDTEAYVCPFCTENVDVPLSIVPAPVDTKDHSWWHIPQHKTQTVYKRLWNHWEYTAGRIIL